MNRNWRQGQRKIGLNGRRARWGWLIFGLVAVFFAGYQFVHAAHFGYKEVGAGQAFGATYHYSAGGRTANRVRYHGTWLNATGRQSTSGLITAGIIGLLVALVCLGINVPYLFSRTRGRSKLRFEAAT